MPSVSIPAAAVIGAGANIYSANEAASAQKSSANKAISAQQGYFNTAQNELQPFINQGQSATTEIGNLEGLNGGTPSSIQATLQSLPGYQFANYQGLKSVQNNATERGLGLSGAAEKGAAAYSTGLANEQYNNLLTGLQQTASTGAGAAGTLTGAATQTGSAVGNNLTGIGNAQAGANIATGNAIGNAAGSIPTGLIVNNLLTQQGNTANNNFLAQSQQAANSGAYGNLSQNFANQMDENTSLSPLVY